MNWTDKALEIAKAIIKDKKLDPSMTEHLRKAAIEGMKWECENFVLKRR